MNNLTIHKLPFKRCWATFDNFLPKPILDSLLTQVEQAKWVTFPKHNRTVMDQLSVAHDPAIDIFFSEQVPKLIYEWTSERVKLINTIIWKDKEGLAYNPHFDSGLTSEHHIQVYLNNGSDQLGTRIHPAWDILGIQTPKVAPYYMNSGVYLNTAHTIRHSVKRVPYGQERISIRVRYVRDNLAFN